MELKDFSLKPCRSRTAFEFIPKQKQKFEMEKIAEKLKEAEVFVEVETPYLIIVKIADTQASIFKSGKIIVKNVDNEEKAREIALKLVEKINKSE